MGYDIEKEKREAIEAGQRALIGAWWICLAGDSFLRC